MCMGGNNAPAPQPAPEPPQPVINASPIGDTLAPELQIADEAMDEAAGTQFTYNFKNEDNEVKSIVVATQNTKPVDTLNALNEGISRMPRVSVGSQQINFSRMSVTEVSKLRSLALTKFVNSITIDPKTGDPQGIAGILTMPSAKFKKSVNF